MTMPLLPSLTRFTLSGSLAKEIGGTRAVVEIWVTFLFMNMKLEHELDYETEPAMGSRRDYILFEISVSM